MAKHVIKNDQTETVDVAEGNAQWLIEKGVTLSGDTAILNSAYDDVSFVIDGKLAASGDGLVSIDEANGDGADNTSVAIGTSGRITAGDMGIRIEGHGTSLRNRGLIQAEGSAVVVTGAATTIQNYSQITSDNNAAIGLIKADDFSVRNDGLLHATGMGSAFVVMSGYGRLVNGEEGVIEGHIFVAGDTGDSTIINRGKIASGASGVTFTGGDDNLVNRGEIEGEIELGSGDDLADLRNGQLTDSAVYGGAGHDTFIVDRSDLKIVEMSGGGSDRITTTVSYTLGDLATDDIETLLAIGKKNVDLAGNSLENFLFGNSGDNEISGGGGADVLNAFKGNDILTGGTGADSFYFGKKGGIDTITDFSLGEDEIDIDHITGIDDFANIQIRMSSVDFDKDGDLDTVIELDPGNRIRLTDIAADDLQMSDFAILVA